MCPDQHFLRPEILRAQVDHPVDMGSLLERGLDRGEFLTGGALADQQAVHLDHQDHRDDPQQQPDEHGTDAVPDRVSGQDREADAEQRENQAQQGPGVLEEHHRKFWVP